MWPGSVPKVGKGRQQCRGVNIQGLWLCSKNRVADDLLWCCQHIRSRSVYTMITTWQMVARTEKYPLRTLGLLSTVSLCILRGEKTGLNPEIRDRLYVF